MADVGRGILYGAYQTRLRHQLHSLPKEALPRHVAMIVDGNRRWARQVGFSSAEHGHRAGAAKMIEFVDWCDDLGIGTVTLYLLSSDNLSNRSAEELAALSDIIAGLALEFARHDDWVVQHVGRSEGLPEALCTALETAEAESAAHHGLHINLAVGYGGRKEIVDAMRSIVAAHRAEGRSLDDLADTLTPELIGAHLYTGGQPDPDLVIRTSGEQRLSDFMLWQAAHSEFYFVEALGPDLREVDFLRAMRDYTRRERRHGG
ncbi:polyprenyl diphosphate synthase [Gryllotalpicola sp.]|uniref:polyprenyl diphosphate synthase n=1 Tax=Gryllotalpicola sp. TaxID=1932787 RepID=UPI002609819F|nr:polyprenyl diphosphate synthase [Gryllotalpicola sp.]